MRKSHHSLHGLLRQSLLRSVVCMILPVCVLAGLLVVLTQRYGADIALTTRASEVRTVLVQDLPDEVWNVVSGRISFEDGRQRMLIDSALWELNDMLDSAGEDEAQYLNAALRAIRTIDSYVDQMETQMDAGAAVSRNESLYREIHSVGHLAGSMLDRYIENEIARMGRFNARIQHGLGAAALALIALVGVMIWLTIRASDNLEGAIGASLRQLEQFANRIAAGRFTLDGVEYTLAVNDGDNHLHGGPTGFSTRVWQADEVPNGVRFTYHSQDMEEGFPGALTAQVTYSLDGNALVAHYQATTDRPTVCNLTNHTYFNLNGHNSGTVLDHTLVLHAAHYTPVVPGSIPTGKIEEVAGTPMDFLYPHTIGQRIDRLFPQLLHCGGYDHNWVLDRKTADGIEPAATVWEPASGRTIEVLTDQPAMQFYSGNFFDGKANGKYGKPLRYRESLALETQKYPDSPNHDNFPSTVLRPGEEYTQVCIYRFGVK